MINLTKKKILVTGGAGFLGSHVVERLREIGVPADQITVPRSADVDLRLLKDCERGASGHEVIIHLAGRIGGIEFNRKKPGEMLYDNLAMGVYMIEAARRAGAEKILALGTICEYPKFTPVPFCEENLWNGYPEETNAPYGLAKKGFLVGGQTYRKQYGLNVIHLLLVNLYGPRDTFAADRSHVIPALIRKVAEAKQKNAPFIEVWGSGRATREFLYVADAARGIVSAVERYDSSEPANLGSGIEISIRDLVTLIARLMEYEGEVRWDRTKPDGHPRRRLDVHRAAESFDFHATTDFEAGLRETIAWYLAHQAEIR